MTYHGSKPSNPQKAPKSHGRKPPAPPPRTGRNMGKSSSSAVAPVVGIAWALLALPIGAVASVVGYILHGNGVL